jgi:hypothetical protein
MSLIKCPDCGAEVSDRAQTCPKCAFPLNQPPDAPRKPKKQSKKRSPIAMGCLIVIGIFALLLIVGTVANNMESKKNVVPASAPNQTGAANVGGTENTDSSASVPTQSDVVKSDEGEKSIVPVSSSSQLARAQEPQPTDIEIIDLGWRIGKYDYLYVTGELKNNSSSPVGAELQVMLRGDNDRLLSSDSFWPASVQNIAPGTTWPFEHMIKIDELPEVKKVQARVIDVKQWRK